MLVQQNFPAERGGGDRASTFYTTLRFCVQCLRLSSEEILYKEQEYYICIRNCASSLMERECMLDSFKHTKSRCKQCDT